MAQKVPSIHHIGAGVNTEPQSMYAKIGESRRFLGWKFAARYQSGFHDNSIGKPSAYRPYFPTRRSRPQNIPPGTANVGFGFRSGLPAGYIPTAAVAGDFNGDGHMDVAISNGGDNTIYVLLGNGDNSFQVPEILYTQGQAPVWIAAASLKNNGHLDLITADADSETVEIFPGNGDGTFQASTQVSVSQIPTFVLTADINKDGKQDVVVGLTIDIGATQPQFLVLLGDGTGGFSGTVAPPSLIGAIDVAIPTGWIASSDLNKDGFPDLVTTITGAGSFTYGNQFGKTFSVSTFFGPPEGAMVTGLGDLDEDGCPDAVELSDYGLVYVAKGTCGGSFSQPALPISGTGDLDPAIQIVDVDGDGHLDVVGSAAFFFVGGPGYGFEGGYLVSVLKGDGLGNVTPAKMYRGGTDDFSLVAADFNGDNKPELLTTDSLENQASLYVNDGTGNYDGPNGQFIGYTHGVTNSPSPSSSVHTADFNGDGHPDLYLVQDGMFASQPSQFTVLLNDGTGNFLPPVTTPITVGDYVPYPQFIAGKFRNTAYEDVIYFNQYSTNMLAFFPSNGNGTFAVPTVLASLNSPLSLVRGDFNGDGKLDFVVSGENGGNPGNYEFDMFLGRGDGTFMQLPAQSFPAPALISYQQIFAADFNHDGKLDVMIGNDFGDVVEVLGNGDGTFVSPVTLFQHFGAFSVADLNRDGYPDLIQPLDPNADNSVSSAPAAMTIYLGGANGTFQQQPSYDFFGYKGGGIPLVGDFNGDGIPDIAALFLETLNGPTIEPGLRVLQGVGDGSYIVTGHIYQLQGSSNPFVGADFNGDGLDDLIELVGYTSSLHTIAAMRGPALDIALNSSPLLGSTGSATVTLNVPSSSAQTVTLSSSDPALQLPSSLQFAAGQQSQSFSFTLGSGVDFSRVFALYASWNGQTAVAYTTKPNGNLSVGVTSTVLFGVYPLLGPVTVTPGESVSLTLLLGSVGGYRGTFSSFQCQGLPLGATCSFAAATAPVPAGGSDSIGFTIASSAATPFGTYPVQVTSTDGFVLATAPLTLGIGDFTLTANPTTIMVEASGFASTTVTSTATNGLVENVVLTCSGLPANAVCVGSPLLDSNGGSASVSVTTSQMAFGDYPFQITGTANTTSHTISALLRVADYTAALDRTSASITTGQATTFTVSLSSINNYSANISVTCPAPSNVVVCSASPQSVSLAPNGTASVTLTVTDTTKAHAQYRNQGRGFLLSLVLLPLACVCRLRKRVSVIVLAILMGTFLGCGGGGSSISGTPNPLPFSTVSIPVFVTATSQQSGNQSTKNLGPIVITVN
ncbi:MAG TPA: FG-GAP-like repeat-containing protein [Terriglobales bacterium]|nr:FG-GAP-like repeat-containing protein [Terriglobales bacterium]